MTKPFQPSRTDWPKWLGALGLLGGMVLGCQGEKLIALCGTLQLGTQVLRAQQTPQGYQGYRLQFWRQVEGHWRCEATAEVNAQGEFELELAPGEYRVSVLPVRERQDRPPLGPGLNLAQAAPQLPPEWNRLQGPRSPIRLHLTQDQQWTLDLAPFGVQSLPTQ